MDVWIADGLPAARDDGQAVQVLPAIVLRADGGNIGSVSAADQARDRAYRDFVARSAAQDASLTALRRGSAPQPTRPRKDISDGKGIARTGHDGRHGGQLCMLQTT